jgi:hypothetical protein
LFSIRFVPPSVIDFYEDGEYDATNFGNACPQQGITWPEPANDDQAQLQELLKSQFDTLNGAEDCEYEEFAPKFN